MVSSLQALSGPPQDLIKEATKGAVEGADLDVFR